jgi:hypothetical protein
MLMRSLVALFLVLAATAQAADVKPQVVVLKNGNVLRGTVESAGDYLRIVSAGSEINLRATDVDLICDSVEAAYDQLRARISSPTAIDHMRIAAWCVRQELWDDAQFELAAARQLEPNHPRIAMLEQTAAHLQRAAQSKPATRESSNATRPESAKSPRSDDLLAELPKEALEDFTRRVQPILVNNCTTSGCHRVDGPQKFQLNRDLLHGMANRRSTTRNLVATLNLVNSEFPLDSELLAKASSAHAGLSTPPLTVRQRELHKRLEEWVFLASGKKPPEPTANHSKEQIATEVSAPRYGVIPASATEEPVADEMVEPLPFDEEALMTPVTTQPLQIGVQLKKWEPRDEFDPEIFNRLQALPVRDSSP